MNRATTSLPTPLSPVISTFAGLFAARSAIESRSVMARLATTIPRSLFMPSSEMQAGYQRRRSRKSLIQLSFVELAART